VAGGGHNDAARPLAAGSADEEVPLGGVAPEAPDGGAVRGEYGDDCAGFEIAFMADVDEHGGSPGGRGGGIIQRDGVQVNRFFMFSGAVNRVVGGFGMRTHPGPGFTVGFAWLVVTRARG
jgi:hypothetical protein